MANSQTLGTCFSPRMRRADIEVPNLPVDVDSWGRSACYPRGSFYPLSDDSSTRCHLITMPDFRLCPTRVSRSQAPFCHCTLRMVSIHSEGTFGRLRYSLGGNRPSQTARLPPSYSTISTIVRISIQSARYPNDDSVYICIHTSQSPAYSVQTISKL